MTRKRDEALRSLVNKATPAETEKLLDSMRWKEDQRVVNDFGEYVWLKPFIRRGKRVGITDCCFVDDPCEHHAAIAKEEEEKKT